MSSISRKPQGRRGVEGGEAFRTREIEGRCRGAIILELLWPISPNPLAISARAVVFAEAGPSPARDTSPSDTRRGGALRAPADGLVPGRGAPQSTRLFLDFLFFSPSGARNCSARSDPPVPAAPAPLRAASPFLFSRSVIAATSSAPSSRCLRAGRGVTPSPNRPPPPREPRPPRGAPAGRPARPAHAPPRLTS